jgi:hypothetical protein
LQKPQATLGQWLRSSTETVPVRCLELLMRRLEHHEAQQHARAATLLSSGEMPDLLYSADSSCVNPAVLCIMHACEIAKRNKLVYLPVPHRDVVCQGNPAGTDSSWQEVGEVWWLFDADQPYLAEVFKNGRVPSSRLPHMDRSSCLKGNHIARVLGCTRPRLKVVSSKQTFCLYTPWYVSCLISLLSSFLSSVKSPES